MRDEALRKLIIELLRFLAGWEKKVKAELSK